MKDLTFRDLIPDSLQGWQEHEEAMDRFFELREVELDAGSEDLLCSCLQRGADSFDGRACAIHAKNDCAKDASLEVAYYNAEVPRKEPVQMQFRFATRRVA